MADTAGVVAKAIGAKRAVQARAFGEVGRAEADDIGRPERQLRFGKAVVRSDIVHDVVERAELLLPVAGRPSGTIEMADRMRGDLVAVAVQIVHKGDARTNLFRRAAETDAGIARR